MNKSESMFFRILDIFAHFVLLNALWIISSIPIVTFFASTKALFRVSRTWLQEGMEYGVIQIFLRAFKKDFLKSFLIGIIWALAGLILYANFSVLLQFDFTGKHFVFTLFAFALILFIFTTIYIFFVLSSYQFTILNSIKYSLLLSVSNLLHTILCIVIIIGSLFLVFKIPILFIISGSAIAFVLTHVFLKLENKVVKKYS